jgi:UDP-glucose 4-epimerase
MKCAVTGGAGFIGSHLVDQLLVEGHEVIVLDNFSSGRRENLVSASSKMTVIETDLARSENLECDLERVDWVFHLAALADIVPSIECPDQYFSSNVDGTFKVLEASRRSGVKRFVYVASSSSYGIPDLYPTPETAPINPQYPYALTKWLGEELVMHWCSLYRMPAISLRFFNVFGSRSRTTGTYGAVFGVFLAQKLAGQPFTVVGDGSQTRDFTYVSDIVDALIVAAKSDRSGQVYNVASGRPVSVNRLVELLGGEVVYIPKRPGEPDCTHADISLIEAELGWGPKVLFEEGVEKLLEHINEWRNAPVWTPEKIADATESWFRYLGTSD